jgi:hypothetical protein
MKVTKFKTSEELKPYAKPEVRDAASKEELHEALFSLDHFLNAIGQIRHDVFVSLQEKMANNEQLSLDFGAYTYAVKKEVKRNFDNDFSSVEEEAKFLEDNGFAAFVSRREETVNTVKVIRDKVKKAYQKNSMPESVASHYSFSEKSRVKVCKPKAITSSTVESE